MNLQEAYALSKLNIDQDICYIKDLEDNKYLARSQVHSLCVEYELKVTKDNTLKIVKQDGKLLKTS